MKRACLPAQPARNKAGLSGDSGKLIEVEPPAVVPAQGEEDLPLSALPP